MIEGFNERLRLAMESKGVTQAELGRAVGVTRSAVNLYLKGGRLPHIDTTYYICEVLGCSIDWLIMGKGSMYRV